MAFQTVYTTDADGRDVRKTVDEDGTVIHTAYRREAWVSEDEYFHVGKKKELKEADREDLERLGRTPEYVCVYQTNMRYVIEKMNLSRDEKVTLMTIMPYVDWQSNFIVDPETDTPMNGREIARKTGENKDLIARGLAGLKRKGIVAAIESGSSREKNYVMNTSLFWKGRRITQHYHHVAHFAKNGLELPVDVKYAKARPST